ncbi:hypothetical protein [Vibrio crassostreae]|uniref:hypothetical protein n=1 Tax=Vibrio crassostreae TaxID=246167 RepID=UPI00104DC0B0|nr:hypothetical protein [Vibrio crassostreae]TCO05750.1 hypothetical protein EDB30_102328 [Vibrio crassostreae]CAK2389153.1 DUF4935 domain-containing protein [Vibrio crassostreae]CAK2587454.1 DUF4935 domain-containing protein [Vibrio crassostreae]CAK2599021.1 DUF4935 domain-containing protein [Vibrio crassostreae]CAK2785790.1 DUF4935 domain-containing protein [Vibrio crassostreae]
MIVYLDQNKWIQLAQIVHGKDKSPSSIKVLDEIKASIDCGYIYPLSATHYQEFSRISNVGRRKRLGQVMWDFSKNKTLASTEKIVTHEIEVALSKFFPSVKPSKLELVGQGMSNAFGRENNEPLFLSNYIDKVLLTGNDELGLEPIKYYDEKFRRNFQSHLNQLNNKKGELERSRWNDWIDAIVLADISEPLTRVMIANSINPSQLMDLQSSGLTELLKAMPSRSIDVHLHRQVLKNSNYNSKLSDLEDWAGLGVAVSYCDVVVCEKHFADMLKRDKHATKAKVVTKLSDILLTV